MYRGQTILLFLGNFKFKQRLPETKDGVLWQSVHPDADIRDLYYIYPENVCLSKAEKFSGYSFSRVGRSKAVAKINF